MLPLHNWCLLPAIKGDGARVLMKISQMDTVLNMESFESFSSFGNVLNNLQITKLDRRTLPKEASKEIEEHLASAKSPIYLLDCMQRKRENFRNIHLTVNDCFAVLNFFSDNLSLMQSKAETWWIRQTMRKLPVFLTHNGNCASVEDDSLCVLVLPVEMPNNGIPEWANSTGRILLCENNLLRDVYIFLEFSFTGSIQIYTGELLPSWDYLPQTSVLEHLEYIRDRLLDLGVGQKYNEQQKQFIQVLMSVPVIPVHDTRKKASQFFLSKQRHIQTFL